MFIKNSVDYMKFEFDLHTVHKIGFRVFYLQLIRYYKQLL
jgi:hypothetical protein